MYIVKDKVFLHMVKSAGISIHEGLINSNQKIHFNHRHLAIDCIPTKYSLLPRYGVIRSPEDWYKSFYNFFIYVNGYMSFMLNDPANDGYIYPIEFNEFVKRSINLKETLIRFPNKARVFNNILRSQGNIHFVTGYFKEAIDQEAIKEGNLSSLEQFDMSLYEWFYNGCGMNTSTNIPMEKLEDIETLFNIRIGHANKTIKKNNTPKAEYNKETLELVRKTHKKFYDEINNYKGLK